MNLPSFAEYRCVVHPADVTLVLPWRHQRVPLDPRAQVLVGRTEAADIRVIEHGAMIDGFGGRKNHVVHFVKAQGWRLSDLGSTHAVQVGEIAVRDHAVLKDGDRIFAAPNATLELSFTVPPITPRLWQALGPNEHEVLDEMNRARPPPMCREGGSPATYVPRLQSWWPPADTPARRVMLDWLMERGLEADEAEVQLAHLHAWHRFEL